MYDKLSVAIYMVGSLLGSVAGFGWSFSGTAASSGSGELKEADIVCDRFFSYPDNYQSRHIKGCTQLSSVLHESLTIAVMRCKTHLYLLRPAAVIRQWQSVEKIKGYFPLTVKAFGVVGAYGHITAVKRVAVHLFDRKADNRSRGLVSGVSITHAPIVNRYTFKDIKTGLTMAVNATPGHTFYIKNKRLFIPIDNVSPTDRLITASGNQVRLICAGEKKNHCGEYDSKNFKTVYNLEVTADHDYFIGNMSLLTHNICYEITIHKNCRLLYQGDGFLLRKGDRVKGIPHGKGVCFHENGQPSYRGSWKYGRKDGEGTEFYDNGEVEYYGSWKSGAPNGFGICLYRNGGIQYIGNQLGGRFHGWGACYYESGEIAYTGYWKRNRKAGTGVLYYKKGMIQLAGKWRNNEIVEGVGHDLDGRLLYFKDGMPRFIPRQYRLYFDMVERVLPLPAAGR